MSYRVLDTKVKDMNVIEITDGDFSGCQFILGGVTFDEQDEGLVHFDYEITNGYTVKSERMQDFVAALGQVLTSLIDDAIKHEEVIYTGGE